MKLVMTLLVRNEADIVEANIEYHLAQGVDFVIVTDHGSDDGTSEILREYERMEVAKVIRDDAVGHHQSNRVTHMADLARVEYRADWVIHNDADEFWWPLVGNLRDVFASVPARFGQIEVQRHNFRPCAEGEGPFYSQQTVREATSLSLGGGCFGPKVAHRPHPQVVVAPGNHSISGAELAMLSAEGMLQIFHFPMRSYEQFERKVLQAGLGYEQVPDRSPGVGDEQLALLEMQRAGKLREYYEGRIVGGEALDRGLRMGTLVVDRRLADFVRALHSGERPPVRPEAASERALLRRMMDALDEVEQHREELPRLHAENASASVLIEQLRAQLAELIERLDCTRSELQSASQALHLLRTSRLMRSTAWARRLYHHALGGH